MLKGTAADYNNDIDDILNINSIVQSIALDMNLQEVVNQLKKNLELV